MVSDTSAGHSPWSRALAWLAAIVLVLLGIYLSHIRFMDTEWLSRAGCLIVMIGIWFGIGGILQEQLLVSRSRWRRRNALIEARARLDDEQADPEKIDKQLEEIKNAFDKEQADATHRLKLSLGVLEVSLLMTGTFLWGFGDLLVG